MSPGQVHTLADKETANFDSAAPALQEQHYSPKIGRNNTYCCSNKGVMGEGGGRKPREALKKPPPPPTPSPTIVCKVRASTCSPMKLSFVPCPPVGVFLLGSDLRKLAKPSYPTALERALGFRNQSSPLLPQLTMVADMTRR